VKGPFTADVADRREGPAPRVRGICCLLVFGLTVAMAGGCTSTRQATRNDVSSSSGPRITNVKQFVNMPRVAPPFDEED